jgi:hypothetical protein
VKAVNIERSLLFPTPIWCIEHEAFAEVNGAILEEIRRVDWQAEHERRGLTDVYERRYREDVFIARTSVESSTGIWKATEFR